MRMVGEIEPPPYEAIVELVDGLAHGKSEGYIFSDSPNVIASGKNGLLDGSAKSYLAGLDTHITLFMNSITVLIHEN